MLLTVLLLATAARHASAASVDEYLRLKRQHGCDSTLSYSHLKADWTAYQGKTLELRGVLNGRVEGPQNVGFMITLDSGQSIYLEASRDNLPLLNRQTSTRIRVLARVGSGVVGNVPPLQTLAIAEDAAVTQREQAQAAQQARREAGQRRAVSRHVAAGEGMKLRPLAPLKGLSEMALKYLSPEAQSIYPAYYAFIANHNKRLRPEEVDAIAVSILYFAQRHRVDPRLVVAMIIAESDFNPRSTSHKGAMGLGQVMPDEARAFGLTNPYDPIQNVRVSVNMLRMKLDMYREKGLPEGYLTPRQIALAMAAYNAGAGAVRKYGGIPPYRETQRYVQRVLNLYKALCGG